MSIEALFGIMMAAALVAIGWFIRSYYAKAESAAREDEAGDVYKEVQQDVDVRTRDDLVAGVRRPAGHK